MQNKKFRSVLFSQWHLLKEFFGLPIEDIVSFAEFADEARSAVPSAEFSEHEAVASAFALATSVPGAPRRARMERCSEK